MMKEIRQLLGGGTAIIHQPLHMGKKLKESLLYAKPIDYEGLDCIVCDYYRYILDDYFKVEVFALKDSIENYELTIP